MVIIKLPNPTFSSLLIIAKLGQSCLTDDNFKQSCGDTQQDTPAPNAHGARSHRSPGVCMARHSESPLCGGPAK